MTKSDLLALGTVGLIGWMLYAKGRAAGTLILRPGRVDNIFFDGISPVLQLSLIVQNTSSSGFTVESMAGEVLSDGYIIGNFSNFSPIQVNGNSQVTIPITLRLGMVGLIQDLITSFNTGDFTKQIKLQGFVNAGFIRAPIDTSFLIGSGLNKKL